MGVLAGDANHHDRRGGEMLHPFNTSQQERLFHSRKAGIKWRLGSLNDPLPAALGGLARVREGWSKRTIRIWW